jgi:hypothetical protein
MSEPLMLTQAHGNKLEKHPVFDTPSAQLCVKLLNGKHLFSQAQAN